MNELTHPKRVCIMCEQVFTPRADHDQNVCLGCLDREYEKEELANKEREEKDDNKTI